MINPNTYRRAMPFPVRVAMTAMIGGAIIIAAVLFAWPSWAQEECGPQVGMLSRWERTFKEVQIWKGMAGRPEQNITTILTQSPTGVWTFMTCQNDVCCIRAGGTNGVFLRGT